MFVLVLVLFGNFALTSCEINGDQSCCNRFEYEYNVLQKLSLFEEKIKELDGAKAVIQELKSTVTSLYRRTDGSSYTRWGRSVCPSGSILVYNGYAAGEYYTNNGGGASILCLHSDPKWNKYVDGFQIADQIYGAEYWTSDYNYQKHLHLHDVPCVVCRIPRSNVLMVPGTNTCDKDFKLEYSGYLMASHYSHANNNEYICVDEEPDTLEGGAASTPGKYLYFVQAGCGALKCPPYVSEVPNPPSDHNTPPQPAPLKLDTLYQVVTYAFSMERYRYKFAFLSEVFALLSLSSLGYILLTGDKKRLLSTRENPKQGRFPSYSIQDTKRCN